MDYKFSILIVFLQISACTQKPLSEIKGIGEPDFSPVVTTSSQETFRCYQQGVYDLCIPSIGQGRRILARASNASPALLNFEIKSQLGPMAQPDGHAFRLPSGDGVAEKALLNASSEAFIFDVTSFFPPFIRNHFNTSNRFSGPNCYAAALAAIGVLDEQDLRYVSLTEFEWHLKQSFTQVTTPRPGDIVVFDSDNSRGHVAVLLTSELIFHKKGLDSIYGYRIIPLAKTSEIEPFEKKPLRRLFGSTANSDDLGKKKKAFYRKKVDSVDPAKQFSTLPSEELMLETVEYFANETNKYAFKGQVGHVMGTLAESVARELVQEFLVLESSPMMRSQLAYARLKSAQDYLTLAIEEELYTSPFAEPRLINRDFCFYDNPFWRGLVQKLMSVAKGRAVLANEIEDFFRTRLAKLDKEHCEAKLLALVR